MKIIELFSGIGGFAKGFHDAGYIFEEHYFSEIDKHAIANYKYNFKNATHIGSVEDIKNGEFKNIDIITLGSPCQDFSLAGQRKGLAGDKSSLIKEAIRLIADIKPNIFIWENVKGAFSSNNGADFAAILQAFANIGGYRLEWQLLNTKWFLPQNRERIYLIGHLDGKSKPRVFPIGEDDLSFNKPVKSDKTKFQTKYCTTIGTMFGERPSDTFIIENNNRLHSDIKMVEIGAMRGRNINSSSDKGAKTTQMLEINKKGISNTITSQIKDNLVIGSIRHFGGLHFRSIKSKVSPTITARARQDGDNQAVILIDKVLRKLTEIECERLQGFPDDWTKYGVYDNEVKEISKTQRYKLIGNAVTVKVVEELAKKLHPLSENK